jgi:hypothetical protein
MNHLELKTFINNTAIPVAVTKTGFLEIIKKQNHENINSNLYAHFMSCGIEAIESVFIGAIINLVEQKTGKHLQFSNPKVKTEVQTPKGNRIDITLEDFHFQNALLIENKIGHILNNDLADYWDYYRKEDSKKAGVLLTLKPHFIPDVVKDKFINITHIEWITEIKKDLNIEFLPENYKIYVTDFINTIENLTKSYAMNESAKFYFENATQVLKAADTMNQAYYFINNQFELIASKLGWPSYGNSIEWRNFWDENNYLDTYFTLITKHILKGELHFMIIIELNRKDKEKAHLVKEVIKNHPQFNDKKEGESKGSYIHFLCKSYSITLEELEHFSDLVVAKIKEDFAAIIIEIIKYLYPDKDISTFESQMKSE